MKKLISALLTLLSLNAIAGLDPKEVYHEAKEGKAVIIDVREKDEIKDGMVDKAQWFPLSKFNTDPDWKSDFQKIVGGKKVFLYCRSGNRSGKAKDILEKEGMKSENLGGYQTLKDILPTRKP